MSQMSQTPHNMPVTVFKLDERGQEKIRYAGRVIARGPAWVQLEAFFGLPYVDVAGLILRQGDRMVEWFYSDRWYNIFEVHAAAGDHLKGWYCNITRPAALLITGEDAGAPAQMEIRADDLALDLIIFPDGQTRLLDEDEFAALDIPAADRAAAQQALADLRRLATERLPPFDKILDDGLAGG